MTTIVARFEQIVAQQPQALAVQTPSNQLSYGALNHAASRLAWAILQLLGQPDVCVGLLLGHDSAAIIAILATLKAGKIYVPILPTLPFTQQLYIVNQAEMRLIVTDTAHLGMAQALADTITTPLLNLDKLDCTLSLDNLPPINPPLSLVALLYTSGSTGQPKGIAKTQSGLLYRVDNYDKIVFVSPTDRFILTSYFGFGASVSTIFTALLKGAALCMFDPKIATLETFVIWLQEANITVYSSTPTFFRQVVMALNSKILPKVRLVSLGGETVYKQDFELYRRYFSPPCLFRVALASTETNLICQQILNHDSYINGTVVPVGYPLADKQVLLLNEQHQPVDPHEIGEIAVKSRNMAQGYWRNPDLTAQKFLLDHNGGERIFLTGDLGRFNEQGMLEHLGRKDFQVKIRGLRVELGAVETYLHALPQIKQAVVIAQTLANEHRLVAYFTSATAKIPTPRELRQALSQYLPDYMLPALFIPLAALPMTASGKVDRQALPTPETCELAPDDDYIAPRNESEQRLAQLWAEMLHLPQVSVMAKFFDLGGHSLLAINLVARINQMGQGEISLATFLQTPTIAQIATQLQQPTVSRYQAGAVALQPVGSNPPLFLVPPLAATPATLQHFAHWLAPEQPVYGFMPLGFDGVQSPHTTVEEMASYYLSEMQQYQPHGPYFIGGLCFGGHVALELAHQLHALGEKVGLVVMLDPGITNHGPTWRNLDPYKYGNEKKQGRQYQAESDNPIERVRYAHHQARCRYIAKPYSGRMVFIQTSQFASRTTHQAKLAGLVAGESEWLFLPHTHHGGFLENELHLDYLANILRYYLNPSSYLPGTRCLPFNMRRLIIE